MRGLLSEYLLKGVYLGLLLFVATQDPDAATSIKVGVTTVGGLVVALSIAGLQKIRDGYQIRGRFGSFLLFLLLESPKLIYGGILLGIAVGAYWVRRPESEGVLTILALAGAGLGMVFWMLLQLGHRWGRISLSLALAAALVGGVLYWLQENPDFAQNEAAQTVFGIRLLLGIPLFYLLTFAGMSEESEIEIGAICAALGLASWKLSQPAPAAQSLSLLVPALLYLAYTVRVLPGLRVFKHVVRGLSHARVGQVKPALGSFRRALQLDPQNKLARETLWKVHRSLDLQQILHDPQIMAMMDVDMCLDRAKSLLLMSGPGPEKLQEAHRLLELIVSQQPAQRPTVDYWKAVAYTHAREFDRAAEALEHVLNAADYAPRDPYREAVLYHS